MKNLALIFAFASALFLDTNAMQSCQPNNNSNNIHAIVYQVEVTPPVEVIQIPSKHKIRLGGLSARSINISCNTYNGIKLYAPIRIDSAMAKEEVAQALCISFGVNSLAWKEGPISSETYDRMFPDFFSK